MLTLLALASLGAPAHAAGGTASVELLQEALGLPGVRGLDLFRGALHPGLQVEGALRYNDSERVGVGQGLRVGGWAHDGVGNMAFLTTVLRVQFGLPAGFSLLVDPAEVGFGLASLPGERFVRGASGLEVANDPPQMRLIGGAGLGLSWTIPESTWALRLSYRAAVEASPPAVFDLPVLPHSTLGFGASYTFGESP